MRQKIISWGKKMKNSVLIIDPLAQNTTSTGHSISSIAQELERKGYETLITTSTEEGVLSFQKDQSFAAILLDWHLQGTVHEKESGIEEIISYIRSRNDLIPIFLFTDKKKIMEISSHLLEMVNGYIWKMEETPEFIASRVIRDAETYLDSLLPPFFKQLRSYALECKYAWHTPWHSGGVAFLKSPVGRAFYDFYGPHIFQSDLSASVSELGSIFEHTGSKGIAEKHAAELFNADISYFVTSGTSTANRIIFSAHLKRGDTVVVDRNCHKSILHSLILTGAIPVYLTPTRNAYGIIGGIDKTSFTKEHIQELIARSPLVEDKSTPPKMVVITNSTYDGILYDVETIRTQLKDYIDVLHFDEAWISYAHFHPLYEKRHATGFPSSTEFPTMFATQSPHKMLAAFSQASMIHVKQGKKPIDEEHLNQSFMMHSSTSPQYTIVASCDVAAHMMKGTLGKTLIDDTIEEALVFREKMEQMYAELQGNENPAERWWFSIWEPPGITQRLHKHSWLLKENALWHGFPHVSDDFLLLDPLKVTILTPGYNPNGKMSDFGIPARIVSKFLSAKGIVEEKTGFYNILTLFSLGITKGKSSILLSTLLDFKKAYDMNLTVKETLPQLIESYPGFYDHMTLKELCIAMHTHLLNTNIPDVIINMIEHLPQQAIAPCTAYERYIEGAIEDVPIDALHSRIAVNVVVPFPPGIPIIMPGERFCPNTDQIIQYLQLLETFSNTFPGFETEIHGVLKKSEHGKTKYYVRCIKE